MDPFLLNLRVRKISRQAHKHGFWAMALFGRKAARSASDQPRLDATSSLLLWLADPSRPNLMTTRRSHVGSEMVRIGTETRN
jgi:hypothetical protein